MLCAEWHEEWELANLAIAGDVILIGANFSQTHWAARVGFLGGNADFSAEAELESVGEAGGDVVVDGGGIHLRAEAGGILMIGGDDALGVFGAVGVNPSDGGIKVGKDFYVEDKVAVLGEVIFWCGRDSLGK